MNEEAQRMAFVTKIDADGIIESPSWDIIKQEFHALKGRPHATLSLYGEANAQMMLEFIEDEGFFISAFGNEETEEWVAIDEGKSSKGVLVDISGNVDEVPQCVLVSDEIALDAVREFYLHGVRSPRQEWKKTIDLL